MPPKVWKRKISHSLCAHTIFLSRVWEREREPWKQDFDHNLAACPQQKHLQGSFLSQHGICLNIRRAVLHQKLLAPVPLLSLSKRKDTVRKGRKKIASCQSLAGRNLLHLPKLRLKITTLAPRLFAPKASALPAPPAPTNTNTFPAMGEVCDASPLATCLSVQPTKSK